LLCLLGTAPVSAKSRKPSARGKAVASSAKKSAKSKPAKYGPRKVRRSAPRQAAPTPDRYMQIQQALADKGFFTGSVNGVWGPDSVAALKQFQESQNLAVDGKLGSLSLIALGLGPKREPISQVAGKPAESVP
jgi:peptidoglycan hydrolase-like protein with peptidoglycan-binding domain